jgi:hypothetical protein
MIAAMKSAGLSFVEASSSFDLANAIFPPHAAFSLAI